MRTLRPRYMNLEAQGLSICRFNSWRQGLIPDLWDGNVHAPVGGESQTCLLMAISVWLWAWLVSSLLHIRRGPACRPSGPSVNQHSLLGEHYVVYRALSWARGSERHRWLPWEGGGCSESLLLPEGPQGGCLAHWSSELTQLSVSNQKQREREEIREETK